MAAISCTASGVSGFKKMSLGATSDTWHFSFTIVEIESTLLIMWVVVVSFGTESTGTVVVDGADVVVFS